MQKISMPATVGKSNSQFLPCSGRHPAAVQQWSNEVRLCTISPNGAPGLTDRSSIADIYCYRCSCIAPGSFSAR